MSEERYIKVPVVPSIRKDADMFVNVEATAARTLGVAEVELKDEYVDTDIETYVPIGEAVGDIFMHYLIFVPKAG